MAHFSGTSILVSSINKCTSTSSKRPSQRCSSYTENLKDYFLKRAPGYEDDNTFHPKLARKTVDLLDLGKRDRVLDVATGTGFVALEVAKKLGPEGLVIGVDISTPMLQQAQAKFDAEREVGGIAEYLFIEANIEDINFQGPCFQHITCSASLPYLQDIPGFFQKARSWLLEGGSLVFNSPQEPYSVLKPLLFSIYKEFGIPAVNTGPVVGSEKLITSALNSAGFTHIEVTKEVEERKEDDITDIEAYVKGQWKGMLKMPMVDLSKIESSSMNEAYQHFCKRGVQFLEEMRDVSGKVRTKPLTTLWTRALC